jgi:preprotein translocase subunit YajC
MVDGILKKGDKIVTSGGITGTISRVVDNDKIEVEIADNVTVEVIRGTGVQSLMNSQEVKK